MLQLGSVSNGAAVSPLKGSRSLSFHGLLTWSTRWDSKSWLRFGQRCGTPDYFAPELIASTGHSHSAAWQGQLAAKSDAESAPFFFVSQNSWIPPFCGELTKAGCAYSFFTSPNWLHGKTKKHILFADMRIYDFGGLIAGNTKRHVQHAT